MFLFLSKILPLFVYPLGLSCLLLLMALALRRYPRWHALCLIVATAVLLTFSNSWVAARLASSLEWQYLPPDETVQAGAIVLLGGGTRAMQPPRVMTELNEGGERMLYAARLFHEGSAPHILVSGGYIEWLGATTTEAEGMLEILLMLGVPREAVWLETESRNTYENAVQVRSILDAKGINEILLVTSAVHMPRAVSIFRHQDFEVIPAPADYLVTQPDAIEDQAGSIVAMILSFLPSADALELSTRAIKEYIGMAVYSLRGWL